MNGTLINNNVLRLVLAFLAIPILIMFVWAFVSTNETENSLSLSGFQELLTPLRAGELFTIIQRAFLIATIASLLSFLISYLLVIHSSPYFQTIFYFLITLPFLVNESVRVFSWQYVLAENGLFNTILSGVFGKSIQLFNGSNNFNIYIIMLVACMPFGVFINSASLKIIPDIYWKVSNDLNISPINRFFKVALPISKFSLLASFIIVFFVAFYLSSEVNMLGGDTKISLRNLILSFMTASKFQAIFSLGCLMLLLHFLITFIQKTASSHKKTQ